jgi:hypothetical protein
MSSRFKGSGNDETEEEGVQKNMIEEALFLTLFRHLPRRISRLILLFDNHHLSFQFS